MFTILSFVIKVLLVIILIPSESVFRFCLDRDSVAGYLENTLIRQHKSPVSTDRGRACADRSSSRAGCGAPYTI